MSGTEDVLTFLDHLGVDAYILPDSFYGILIMIETNHYELHRRQIDAWFTCVRQIGDHSYFHIRLRGTGDTNSS